MKLDEVILKSGQKCVFQTPTLKYAQDLADYANKIRTESKFLLSCEQEPKFTLERETSWIKSQNIKTKFIVMATIKGKVVGLADYSSSTKFRKRHICSMGISVLKEFWNLGIASHLMQILIDTATKTGFEIMDLTVNTNNKAGIHLYKKFGFEKTGTFYNDTKYEDGTYADTYYMQKYLKEIKGAKNAKQN